MLSHSQLHFHILLLCKRQENGHGSPCPTADQRQTKPPKQGPWDGQGGAWHMTAYFLSSYRQNMWASSAQTTTVKKTEGQNAELSNSCFPQHVALLNSWVFRHIWCAGAATHSQDKLLNDYTCPREHWDQERGQVWYLTKAEGWMILSFHHGEGRMLLTQWNCLQVNTIRQTMSLLLSFCCRQ